MPVIGLTSSGPSVTGGPCPPTDDLPLYAEPFWFPDGTLARNTPARVFQHETNVLAPLFSDAAGTVPLPNPLNTNGSGVLRFHVATGHYWIHMDTEAFDTAIGCEVQPATLGDIAAEAARADLAYAPFLHALQHADGGTDEVTLAQSQITGLTAALASLVAGPGSATDNALARFDGTTGKLVQNSSAGLSDAGALTLAGDLNATTGYTTIGNGQANGDWSVFGTTTAFGFFAAGGNLGLGSGVSLIGFFGAPPVAQPNVTGSRGGNAALASLLTALDTIGLVTDSTTP